MKEDDIFRTASVIAILDEGDAVRPERTASWAGKARLQAS